MKTPRKSPYLRKKEDYAHDFRTFNSQHARKNHAKAKKRLRRTVRRKVKQKLTQIARHYVFVETETFPSSSFHLYRVKSMKFKPSSLREIIEQKQKRRTETLILQNFFKEVCEICGCCRRYYYTPYRKLCKEKQISFKNFLRSLINNEHGYSKRIAHYLFHCLYEVPHSFAYYPQRIQSALEDFFKAEPSWEKKIHHWILSQQPNVIKNNNW